MKNIITNLTNLILAGDVTTEEVIEIFFRLNVETLILDNGYTLHWRKEADYVWVSGGTGEESFELGISLFNAITKNAAKEMVDINSNSMKVEV